MARARETFIAVVAAVTGGTAVYTYLSVRPRFAPDVPSTMPAARAAARRPAPPTAEAGLRARNIGLPLERLHPLQIPDTFHQARGGRIHEAVDIMAPRGTPVLAVDHGRVVKLFTSKQGGLTVYQFDPTESYAYYYAHLDRYAPGLAEGQVLQKGDRIGDVGSTGNASPDAPHLHFTIFKLGPERRWWQGTPINPLPFWRVR